MSFFIFCQCLRLKLHLKLAQSIMHFFEKPITHMGIYRSKKTHIWAYFGRWNLIRFTTLVYNKLKEIWLSKVQVQKKSWGWSLTWHSVQEVCLKMTKDHDNNVKILVAFYNKVFWDFHFCKGSLKIACLILISFKFTLLFALNPLNKK